MSTQSSPSANVSANEQPIDTTAPPHGSINQSLASITQSINQSINQSVPIIDASHPNAHLIAALQQQPLMMPLNAVASNNPEVMQAALAQCYQSMMMAQFAAAMQMNSQPTTPRSATGPPINQSINQSVNQQMQMQQATMNPVNPLLMAQMSNPAFFPFMFPFTPRILPSSIIAPPNDHDKGSTDSLDFNKGVVRCICDQFHDTTPMIRCGACNVWQHANCLGITAETLRQEQEYYCELCSPEHPVHIAREILQQNQEREYRRRLKAQLRAARSEARASKKRKRSKHSSKSKKDRTSISLDDAELLAEFDEEMREWHARFKQDIDADLFEVASNGEEEPEEILEHTEQSSATSASPDEASDTKVNEEDDETESESEESQDDYDNGERPRYVRNLDDVSEADLHAAAAISLLSPATHITKDSMSSPQTKPPSRFGFHFDVSRRSSPSHTRTPSPMLPLPSRHHRSPSLSSKSPLSTPKSASNRAALVASLSSSALTNGQSLLPSRSSSRVASPRAQASPRQTT